MGPTQHLKPSEKPLRPQLLIVQPYLTAYRLPVFAELAAAFQGTLLASSPPTQGSGYGETQISGTAIRRQVWLREWKLLQGRLFWQQGLLALLLRERPHRVLLPANPRGLSMWAALLLCRLLGLRCFAYGQGLYDKPTPPIWLVTAYRLLIALSRCYICYTDSGKESLRRQGIRGRVVVAANSLRLEHPVMPREKSGQENGILFVGRLREGCNLRLLIDAVSEARRVSGQDLHLHVVGSGTDLMALQSRYAERSWIRWHGEVYDQATIRSIAANCRVGCYPGHAGLSVVHYMGLSLVPVVHDRLDLHMGPEPSYVVDLENGRRFSYSDASLSLPRVLIELFQPGAVTTLADRAFQTYSVLNTPSLGTRLARIIEVH